MKDKGGITVANGSGRGQEVDEGHEDQSRVFDKATQCFNFNVFSAVKEQREEREVKTLERPFPNSWYLHLCCDHHIQVLIKGRLAVLKPP